MQNIKLQYHGFKPSAFVRRYLNSVLLKSTEGASEKSFLAGHFSRNKKHIKGVVQLTSRFNQVSAVAEGVRLKDVTKRISTQLKKKIQKKNKIRMRRDRISALRDSENEVIENSQITDGPYLTEDGEFHDFKIKQQQAV